MRFPLIWLFLVAILVAIIARAEENKTAYKITNQQIQDWTNDLKGQPNTDCELIVTRFHRNCRIDLSSECTQELRNEYLVCNKMKKNLENE